MIILLADDHKLLRDGLRPLLGKVHPQARVLEANDFPQAMTTAHEAGGVDLALLDLRMPGMEGLSGLTRFMQAFPTARVVLLSAFGEPEIVVAAVEAGAAGFIPKTIGGRAFVSALKLILAGEVYVPYGTILEARDHAAAAPAPEPPLEEFSEREWQIMALLVEGRPNKLIAWRLGLREPTVKGCLRGLYRKLGAANRAQAVTSILALKGRLR